MPTTQREWQEKGRKHVGSVLEGRCDTRESAEVVASAIAASDDDAVLQMMQTPEFAEATKAEVQAAVAAVEEHWTAHLSVHV